MLVNLERTILISLLCLVISARPSLAQSVSSSDAKEVATMMQNEEFEQIRAKFTDPLAQKLSADHMKDVWDSVIANLGDLTDIGEPQATQKGSYQIFNVKCTCQNGLITIRVVYNAAGKIDGLWVLPAQ